MADFNLDNLFELDSASATNDETKTFSLQTKLTIESKINPEFYYLESHQLHIFLRYNVLRTNHAIHD